jgi:uncharacterized protein YndB with AHSA1/START domain
MTKTDDMKSRVIKRSVLIHCTPEKLFGFISTTEGMTKWFCQRAQKTDEGFVAEWDTDFGPLEVNCKTTEVVKDKIFSFLFGYEADNPSLNTEVTFTIEMEDNACLFTVHESGFGEGEVADEAIAEHGHGWNYFLIRLAEYAGVE